MSPVRPGRSSARYSSSYRSPAVDPEQVGMVALQPLAVVPKGCWVVCRAGSCPALLRWS